MQEKYPYAHPSTWRSVPIRCLECLFKNAACGWGDREGSQDCIKNRTITVHTYEGSQLKKYRFHEGMEAYSRKDYVARKVPQFVIFDKLGRAIKHFRSTEEVDEFFR
jgi:hypothetical protein